MPTGDKTPSGRTRRIPRYTLEQLLAEHGGEIPRWPEWENLPPVGLEAWSDEQPSEYSPDPSREA